MRDPANPPALAASEFLGGRLLTHLEVLATLLPPHLPRLEPRFRRRLTELGFSPLERKALAAITPGAAAGMLASRRLPPDFIEQVEYHGRRLAKLNLPSERIVLAFREYELLLAGLAGRLDANQRARLNQALEQWQFCVVVTLNNAFRQVADALTGDGRSAEQSVFLRAQSQAGQDRRRDVNQLAGHSVEADLGGGVARALNQGDDFRRVQLE